MQRFRFPIAVALTSLGVVALLLVGGVALAGAVRAGGLGPGGHYGGPLHGGPWGGGQGAWSDFQLPAQLSGLRDVPEGERFAHFKGVQVTLTDKDNQPVVIAVTPGTASQVSATSLTIDANDGATRTYGLDAQTMIHGSRTQAGNQPGIAQGDKVVVVTVSGSNTAMAVLSGDHGAWGRGGPFGG